jgi:Trypsin-like peptidase domain
MRREDLGEPPWRDEPPYPGEGADVEAHAGLTDAPPTLEEALRVPDLDDGEVVRSIWDDLAGEAPVIERPVDVPAAPVIAPEPADEPDPDAEPEPRPLTRRAARRANKERKHERKLEKLRKRRHRILPRTVIGIASMLLFFGLGVGVAGAGLYAYYDWRLSENEQRIGELSEGLENRLEAANEGLTRASENAVQNIRNEAAPLRALLEEQRVAANLTGRLDGSVWFVETLDENGAPSVGSAFVAASDDSQSLLVTSFGAVAAGTTEPAPVINVRSGVETLEAELYNWDPEHDLALLILPRGNLEPIPWADSASLSRIVGRHVWAVEGIGGNGVSLSPGTVIDQTDVGVQHTAALNPAFRGGPIVNGRGEVVAVASSGYLPLGYPAGGVSFGVPVQAACERVLTCNGDVPGAGDGS